MPDTIEAEVIAVDGAPPPPSEGGDEPRGSGSGEAWRGMKSRVLNLDRRWWPLWVVLGGVALAVALVFGAVFLVLMLLLRLIGAAVSFIRGLFR